MAANKPTLFTQLSKSRNLKTPAPSQESSSSSSSNSQQPSNPRTLAAAPQPSQKSSKTDSETHIHNKEKFDKFLQALQSCTNFHRDNDVKQFKKLLNKKISQLSRIKKNEDGSEDYAYFSITARRFFNFRVRLASNEKGYVCNKLENDKETGIDNLEFEFKYDQFRLEIDADPIVFGLGIGSQSQNNLYDESSQSQSEDLSRTNSGAKTPELSTFLSQPKQPSVTQAASPTMLLSAQSLQAGSSLSKPKPAAPKEKKEKAEKKASKGQKRKADGPPTKPADPDASAPSAAKRPKTKR